MNFFGTLKDKITQVTAKAVKATEPAPFDVAIVEEAKPAKAKKATKKVEVVLSEETQTFESVTKAAEYLSGLFNLKMTNAKDCIYKSLKGTGKSHGFLIAKTEDGKITLTQIVK